MQQFIPFEDEWEALEQLDPSCLVPFQIDLPCRRAAGSQRYLPMLTSASGTTSNGTDTSLRLASK